MIGVIVAGVLATGIFFVKDYQSTKSQLQSLKNTQEEFQTNFQSNFSEELFKDQLKSDERFVLSQELQSVQKQLEDLTAQKTTFALVPTIYANYQKYLKNLEQNTKAKLNVDDATKASGGWAQLLLDQKFDEVNTNITDQNQKLTADYQKYLASIAPPVSTGGEGYFTQRVSTEKGTFTAYVIKASLSSVKVVTASANGDNCKNDCPTKSLEQHIKDNGGYAGMNGTYFCPPDYADCKSKVNSYDYAFYKSSSKKWLNSNALGWEDTGLITFNGSSAKFYKESTSYDGDSVTAGISNYPSLVADNDIVVDNDELTSFQKAVKGTRGVIGVGDSNVYLALIAGATVEDAAYVARALGMKNALNLDGGGSSAMYINNGYVIGPGRSLPNAVVLVK